MGTQIEVEFAFRVGVGASRWAQRWLGLEASGMGASRFAPNQAKDARSVPRTDGGRDVEGNYYSS